MSNQFLRTEMLIGKEALEKLKISRVAVFGIGGVGGYVVEALARAGVGTLDIIDNDTISVTNINRQIIALNSTVGLPKVEVAKSRLLDINPNMSVNTYQTFYTPQTADDFDFQKYDYVVDAIDTVVGKLELITRAKQANVPIICSMGTGNKLNPTMFEVTDISKTSVCPLAKVIRQELKKRRITKVKVVYSKEIPQKPIISEEEQIEKKGNRVAPASNSFCPAVAGLILASEVIKDLIAVEKAL